MEDNGYKVLSLFDGMGCAQLAMMEAGLSVDRYVSYETDRYCNVALAHNFPWVEQRGDVFDADFTEFEGFDFLMGGSPCTYWSVAQSADRRETTASGQGWELFQQYVRALHEARPRWFIYENNKSMSKAIRDSISEAFGFEPVHIDSALVSAQHRQRLYWVGRREEDGTYSQVHVEQPADRGILLRDVLETGEAWQDKSYVLTTTYSAGVVHDTVDKHRRSMVAEPVGETVDGKSFALRAEYARQGTGPAKIEYTMKHHGHTKVAEFIEDTIRPSAMRQTGRRVGEDGHRKDNDKSIPHWQRLEVNKDSDKTNALTTVQKDNVVAVPIKSLEYNPPEDYDVVVTDRNIRATTAGPSGVGGTAQGYTVMLPDSKTNAMTAGHCGKSKVIEPVPMCVAQRGRYVGSRSRHSDGGPTEQHFESRGQKTNALTTVQKDNMVAMPIGAESAEATSNHIYEVTNGEIEIRGRRYPIKLHDGRYIIRKLTVRECMRLQTVPEWYDFSCVSNNQAYKMLGNGWTVEVIVHLIESIMGGEER